jgi:hypothetical protein
VPITKADPADHAIGRLFKVSRIEKGCRLAAFFVRECHRSVVRAG